MSRELSALLKSKCSNKEDSFSDHLEVCSNEIIDTFGGIENMLYLCLQNNDDDGVRGDEYYLNSDQLLKLKQVITERNDYSNIESLTEQRKRSRLDDILLIDASNNFFFKFLSVDRATKYYYRLRESKWTVFIFIIFIMFGVIFAAISNTINGHLILISILRGIGYFVTTLIIIITLLGTNVSLVWEISQTFDFIYKFIQIIVVMMSAAVLWRNDNVTIFRIICITIPWIFILLLICYVDAVNYNEKYKMIAVFFGVCALFITLTSVYFQYDEVIWDPFGETFNGSTAIQWKSLFLSSMTNFLLFTAKPLITGIKSYIFNKQKIKKGIIKSTALIDHPSFKWFNQTSTEYQLAHSIRNQAENINADDNTNDIELHTK